MVGFCDGVIFDGDCGVLTCAVAATLLESQGDVICVLMMLACAYLIPQLIVFNHCAKRKGVFTLRFGDVKWHLNTTQLNLVAVRGVAFISTDEMSRLI